MQVFLEKTIKTFEGKRILKIHHEFAEGSITPVIGPSGCGKTTFLRILAGLIPAEKGKICFMGQDWLDTDKKIFVPTQKRNLGMVFQNYALFPNMSVLEHLRYASQDPEWIGELLELGKLESLGHHKPEHLSGGQQQRLALIRALAPKPKLLLLDEPFSALDKEIKSHLLLQLQNLWKRYPMTCLWVSHHPEEMEAMDLEIPLEIH